MKQSMQQKRKFIEQTKRKQTHIPQLIKQKQRLTKIFSIYVSDLKQKFYELLANRDMSQKGDS